MFALGRARRRTYAAVAGTTAAVAGIGTARIVLARILGPQWWFVASTAAAATATGLPLALLETLFPAVPIPAAAPSLALAAPSLAHAATATGRKKEGIIAAAFAFAFTLAAARFQFEDIVFVLTLGVLLLHSLPLFQEGVSELPITDDVGVILSTGAGRFGSAEHAGVQLGALDEVRRRHRRHRQGGEEDEVGRRDHHFAAPRLRRRLGRLGGAEIIYIMGAYYAQLCQKNFV